MKPQKYQPPLCHFENCHIMGCRIPSSMIEGIL
ncbi:hypothetical protein SSSM7_084 [Synechococcus phage S-SSM7]|uniref:Uncharacterized protein n=1 Tax=Synechococcus phage S-SSM7 TaxID=445686 RepID=E3SL02_9CAUD|nr:hypothetical protein SSSM7_084 [Synechococcus phage S-SSM7]ADO98150.1 hypothetical protein SSSM7_084 [Synechococcus phage S-SSM7]